MAAGALLPMFGSNKLFASAAELNGTLIDSIGAENGELWARLLLLGTTGNKG